MAILLTAFGAEMLILIFFLSTDVAKCLQHFFSIFVKIISKSVHEQKNKFNFWHRLHASKHKNVRFADDKKEFINLKKDL